MPHGFSRTAHAAWHGATDRLARWTCDLSVFLAHEAQRSRRIAFGMDPPGRRRAAILAAAKIPALLAVAIGSGALLALGHPVGALLAAAAVATTVFIAIDMGGEQ